jgi:hypothetical protein
MNSPLHADFWIRMALAAFVIIGVWNALGPGMILGSLGDWMEKWPKWLSKPLGLCPPCMASVYGTTVYFTTGGEYSWWWAPAFVIALSGLMKLIAHNLLRNG